MYYSRTVAIFGKVGETENQSASSSSHRSEPEAATMDDRGSEAANNTIDSNSRCYYADSFHSGGAVKPAFAVRMKSKATPRWRHVCVDCCHWMTDDSLLLYSQELPQIQDVAIDSLGE